MSIYTPTYLYIKQHSVTGLKYFGKTINDPLTYLGSGKYWRHHINKHGKQHVTTLWYQLFTNRDALIEYAASFSTTNNIVESADWANLMPENGVNGGPVKNNYLVEYNKKPRSVEHVQAIKDAQARLNMDHKNASKRIQVGNVCFASMRNAAVHFGVHERLIYKWIKTGEANKL